MPDRMTVLLDAYEDEQGRPATTEERAGIERAIADSDADSVLAKVALGDLLGVNGAWPVAHRTTARAQYGLAA